MIAALVMMALGRFRFGINSDAHQRLTRTSPYRWPAQERIGREPALQFVGPGVETMTLAGTIHPHFRGGLRQVDGMRAQAGRGVPMMMVDGHGFVWRRWVIVNVSETRTVLMADGAPRQIDFTLELQRYGEDRL
ncbi:MAG: phage tail protein [Shimia sp.]